MANFFYKENIHKIIYKAAFHCVYFFFILLLVLIECCFFKQKINISTNLFLTFLFFSTFIKPDLFKPFYILIFSLFYDYLFCIYPGFHAIIYIFLFILLKVRREVLAANNDLVLFCTFLVVFLIKKIIFLILCYAFYKGMIHENFFNEFIATILFYPIFQKLFKIIQNKIP
jgi:cell shape-determining protein MreD